MNKQQKHLNKVIKVFKNVGQVKPLAVIERFDSTYHILNLDLRNERWSAEMLKITCKEQKTKRVSVFLEKCVVVRSGVDVGVYLNVIPYECEDKKEVLLASYETEDVLKFKIYNIIRDGQGEFQCLEKNEKLGSGLAESELARFKVGLGTNEFENQYDPLISYFSEDN